MIVDQSYQTEANIFNLEAWSCLNWVCGLPSNKMQNLSKQQQEEQFSFRLGFLLLPGQNSHLFAGILEKGLSKLGHWLIFKPTLLTADGIVSETDLHWYLVGALM